MSEAVRVFVYGSLKRKGRSVYNHKRFGLDALPLEGVALLEGFYLWNVNRLYPALTKAPDHVTPPPVEGEVYVFPPGLVSHLDIVEGGAGYRRRQVRTTLGEMDAYVISFPESGWECIRPDADGVVRW